MKLGFHSVVSAHGLKLGSNCGSFFFHRRGDGAEVTAPQEVGVSSNTSHIQITSTEHGDVFSHEPATATVHGDGNAEVPNAGNISNPTMESRLPSSSTERLEPGFVVPHTVFCDESSEEVKRSNGVADKKKTEKLQNLSHCGANQKENNDEESLEDSSENDTSSVSDSDEEWLPSVEDSPSSSEYFMDTKYNILTCPVRARETDQIQRRTECTTAEKVSHFFCHFLETA